MIKLLSHSVIALTLVLGFAPTAKPITVSKGDNLYAQATTIDKEKLATAEKLLQEGFVLFEQGTKKSLLQALEKWQETLSLYQAAKEPLGEATTLLGIGRVYDDLGNKEKALDFYNQALSISREVRNRTMESVILTNLGVVHNSLGDKEKALDFYNQALAILQEIGDKGGEAVILGNLGVLYYFLGDKEKALDFHNQALAILQEIGDKRGEGKTLNDLGLVYDSLGDKEKALDFHNQALSISREVGDKRGEGAVLNGLGLVYDSLGEKKKALDFYNQALPILREVGDKGGEATTLNNLGLVYDDLGDKEKALDFYNQALPILREVGDKRGEATTLNNLGAVYDDLGEKKKALDFYNQALSISREVGNRTREAVTLNNLGLVYDDLGDKKKALDFYNQALSISREVRNKGIEAVTLNNLGLVYYHDKNYSLALENIEQAIEIVEEIRFSILSSDLKASFLSIVEDYYKVKTAILMQLHQQNPNKGYDVLAFENSEQSKARSLLELLEEANIDIRKGVNPELVNQEKRLQNKLSAIEKRRINLCSKNCSQKLLKQLEIERSQLLEEYKTIQAKIRATSPEYAKLTQPEPIKLKQLQELLDEDTVLWQYSIWRDRSYIWVITKDTFNSYELSSRQQIETIAREYQKLLKDSNESEKLISTGKKLTQLILPPGVEAIKKSRIVIVSDGALQYIPFASLATENNNLLSKRYQLVNLPSSSVLDSLRTNQTRKRRDKKQLAILADPVFSKNDTRLPQKQVIGTENLGYDPLRTAISSSDLNLSRLKGTRKEAETIVAFVPKSEQIAVFDWDANLEFATNPKLSNYNIVHFATHGILNTERPELSGVVLSLFDEQGKPKNGFLRLHEVFNLNLPADLVVLSACETGLGKEIRGEGLVGLTRGFMYAGATRVLVSLWKVDDAATAEFMSKFYSFMLQDNLSPSSALNATQKHMQQHSKWNHPYYWAAFTLQGDWVQQ